MKKLLLLVTILALSLFMGCGDDGDGGSKKCDPACGDWQTCDDGTCKLAAGKCDTNANCTDAAKPVCNTANHTCEADVEPECTTDAECTTAPKTKCQEGVCVDPSQPECTVNADCTNAAKPVCSNGVCIADVEPECTTNADCTEAPYTFCDDGVCIEDQSACAEFDCTAYANTECKVVDAEASCYCLDGYMVNAAQDGCEPIPECTDDNVPNEIENSLAITAPYNQQHHSCTAKYDYYKIDLTAGTPLFANLAFASGDLDLYLLNAPVLAEANLVASSAKEDTTSESFSYVAEATQTYYLVVAPYQLNDVDYTLSLRNTCEEDAECGGAPLICQAGACVEYCESDADCEGTFVTCNTTSHKCEEGVCPEDTNANLTAATAKVVSQYPYENANLAICTEAGDWFKVTLAAGDNLFITAEFVHANGDLDMDLYFGLPTEDSDSVAYAMSSSDNEVITYVAQEAGEYYLHIFGYDGDLNTYGLTIKNTCTTDEECGGAPLVCNESGKCEEHCTAHTECPDGTYCSNTNECLEYVACSQDSDCAIENSVNSSDAWYCQVLASEPVCLVQVAHTCGGESTNDSHSVAEVITAPVTKQGVICVEDADWYKLTLTNASNSATFTLTFATGDLDLVVLGPDSASNYIGTGALEQDPEVGGTETVNLQMAQPGEYYVMVYRYQTAEEEAGVDGNYTLTISEVAATPSCTTNDDCVNTMPLRSVCEEGACVNMVADHTVAAGDFCENSKNCQETEAMYGCLDFGEGISATDNYCSINCESDADCDAIGGGWCQGFGWFGPYICLKSCTENTYCQDLFGDEAAVCTDGVCGVPEEK